MDHEMDAPQGKGSSIGVMNLIESHPAVVIGIVVVVGALVLAKVKGTSATATTTASSGLTTDANGNKIVYVPTTTSWTTENIGQQNTGSGNVTNQGTITGVTNNPPPVVVLPPPVVTPPVIKPPVTPPPTHTPAPPAPTKYGLVWGARHEVTSDDTNHGAGAVAYMASQSTHIIQSQQHAPSSVSVTAGSIVNHNPGVRTNSILKIGQTIILPSYERIS